MNNQISNKMLNKHSKDSTVKNNSIKARIISQNTELNGWQTN